MTGLQTAVVAAYAVIVVIWPIRLVVLAIILGRQRPINAYSPRFEEANAPLVTAILPAKDEEKYLADCLQSIRGQTYLNLEILVVDDRSADRTGEIARAIAASDRRVRVLTIDELPPGWTGKTHALKHASQFARGDWLLFVDADTLHAPESLSIMMEFARTSRTALASLLPELRCETFWERVMQPIAAITLMQSFPLDSVNSAQSPLAFANGQYILIERSAYDAAGGHESVRDRFVEDIALARRVKAIGLPIRVTLARGIVSCRMYASFRQVIAGWSRIFYDSLERNPWRITQKLLDPVIFCQSGHLALAASLVMLGAGRGEVAAMVILGLALIHHMMMYLVFRRVYVAAGVGTRWAAFYPVANIVVDMILIRALWMCHTGQVTWRGTGYAESNTSTSRSVAPTSRPI